MTPVCWVHPAQKKSTPLLIKGCLLEKAKEENRKSQLPQIHMEK